MKSTMLLDERPLIVLPKLAVKVGLNEAIFLQQIHYFLTVSNNEKNGRTWTYHSYESLAEQFPFFSLATIKRIIKKLKDMDILIVEMLSDDPRDRTNWYSINYEILGAEMDDSGASDALGQNEPMDRVKMSQSDRVKMSQCIKDIDYDIDYKHRVKRSSISKKPAKTKKNSFAFSLSKNTAYENLSDEYRRHLKAYAITKDQGIEFEAFIDHHSAKGSKFKDWSRAYNTWLRQGESFGRSAQPPQRAVAIVGGEQVDAFVSSVYPDAMVLDDGRYVLGSRGRQPQREFAPPEPEREERTTRSGADVASLIANSTRRF